MRSFPSGLSWTNEQLMEKLTVHIAKFIQNNTSNINNHAFRGTVTGRTTVVQHVAESLLT